MSLIDALRKNDSVTQNGAVTHSTSLNAVLDLFFLAGACRTLSETTIEDSITKAFAQDEERTLKLIFWAGDVRQGPGERRFFKVALNYLNKYKKDLFEKNFHLVPEYNRWDSLFAFSNNEQVLNFVQDSLLGLNDSLLAKWLPREGKAGNQIFRKRFMEHTKLTPKQYRKVLVELSNTVEQKMSAKDFKSINYSHVPSVAFNKYRKAFKKKDEVRFKEFLDKVVAGKATINASAIFPHDIYKSIKTGGEEQSISLQWNSLPDYLEGSNERILPVCDVSASMSGTPMDISVSLGIYLSERNTGIFKDAFMTFSEKPQLQILKGNLFQRVRQLEKAHWGYNTNLTLVFEKILQVAVGSKVEQKDMPTKILIISDMEFDQACAQKNNMEVIKEYYEKYGYKVPQLVFWNVNARSTKNFPVQVNDKGAALVSGASPVVVKSVLGGKLDPISVMDKTILNERYEAIKV